MQLVRCAAAQNTVSCVKVVRQEASPTECVLLSISNAARKRMTAWRNENIGCFWAVKLDVRDLRGHLDATQRALAGTLSSGVKRSHISCHFSWSPLHGVSSNARDGVFQMLGRWAPWMSRGCYLGQCTQCLRICGGTCILVQKIPRTNTPALLRLLDGLWGSDPAFFVVWSRFRQLRRYLACRPGEVDRIYRLLACFSFGTPGHWRLDSHGTRRKLYGSGLVCLPYA